MKFLARIREWFRMYDYARRLERDVDILRTQLAASQGYSQVLRSQLARKREAEWHAERGLESKLNARLPR